MQRGQDRGGGFSVAGGGLCGARSALVVALFMVLGGLASEVGAANGRGRVAGSVSGAVGLISEIDYLNPEAELPSSRSPGFLGLDFGSVDWSIGGERFPYLLFWLRGQSISRSVPASAIPDFNNSFVTTSPLFLAISGETNDRAIFDVLDIYLGIRAESLIGTRNQHRIYGGLGFEAQESISISVAGEDVYEGSNSAAGFAVNLGYAYVFDYGFRIGADIFYAPSVAEISNGQSALSMLFGYDY